VDPLTGRSRAQNKGTSRGPARAWGGDDPITRIASIESISEPAVCPDCHIMSKLVHLSGSAIAATTEQSMIPCMVMEDVLRKTRCILCTIADNAVVRAQEAHAGHIWFLIGDASDENPPEQQALNQHYWSVVAHPLPRHRLAARQHILELAASKGFGTLVLPHMSIAEEERQWLLSEMRNSLGNTVLSVLGVEAINAFIDQYGVPLLMAKRSPRPEWIHRVRFVPTPEGIETYNSMYSLGQPNRAKDAS